MATMIKLVPADPMRGSTRHIEDFREFFSSRGVSFGSAEDLPPFVARLSADARFRDEMASMVRTVIYRERDGVSQLELVEMIAVAVEGTQPESARQPEILDAERQVVAFIDGVFRTRWNPGEASVTQPTGQDKSEVVDESAAPAAVPVDAANHEAVAAGAGSSEVAQPAPQPHATTDLFYRAQVVAGVEPAEAIVQERRAENGDADYAAQAPAEPAHESLSAADYEALPLRVDDLEEIPAAKKTSRFWMWTAGVCALVLAFCAGLFVHQRLLVPLRDPHQPYEQPPADTAPEVTPEQAAIAGPAVSAPAVGESRTPEAGTRGAVRHGAQRGAANGSAEARRPAEPERAIEGSGEAVDLQPRYMAPAMIGASPALMASHLVYAPPPGYPMLAQVSHIQGRVLVEAVVDRSGHVIRAQAISGHRLLRGAAVREVYERRYRPYLLNDRPTNVATIVAVDFRLGR